MCIRVVLIINQKESKPDNSFENIQYGIIPATKFKGGKKQNKER